MFHINKWEPAHLTAIQQSQPPVVLVLDPPVGVAALIKTVSPRTKVIIRYYVRDQDLHATYLYVPFNQCRQAGRNAAQICIARKHEQPGADAWVVLNEPPSETVDQVRRLSEFDIGFMEALYEHGMRGCIGTFSVGTPKLPSDDGGESLLAYVPALERAAALGAWLAIHQYSAARPFRGGVTPSGWLYDPRYYALRWQLVILPWLRARGVRLPFYVITECGLDLGPAKDHGYQGRFVGWRIAAPWGYGDSDTGARDYLNDLLWLFGEYAKDPLCLGVCIFCAGDNGDERWWSFMVDGVLLALMSAAMWPVFGVETPVPTPTPPPPPPGGGSTLLVQRLQAALGSRFHDVRGSLPRHASKTFAVISSRLMRYLVLHYSTGRRNVTAEAIARHHVFTNLWAAIGYHFVVRMGHLFYVGDVDTARAHILDRNDEGLGVCVTGTYPPDELAAEDLEVLRILVAVLDEFFGHRKEIVDHGQLMRPGYTSCAGTLKAAIPLLRLAPPAAQPSPQFFATVKGGQDIDYNPNTALARAARAKGYNSPLSEEDRITENGVLYIGQLFGNATGDERIFWCKDGDWGNVKDAPAPRAAA